MCIQCIITGIHYCNTQSLKFKSRALLQSDERILFLLKENLQSRTKPLHKWLVISCYQCNTISLGNDCAKYCLLIKGSRLRVSLQFCLSKNSQSLERIIKSYIATVYYNQGGKCYIFSHIYAVNIVRHQQLIFEGQRLMLQLEMLAQAFKTTESSTITFTPTSGVLEKNRSFIYVIDVVCPLMNSKHYHY